METVKKFLEEFKKDPEAAKLLNGEKPLSGDEILNRLADAAQKLGFNASEAELKDYFENVQKNVMEKSDSVAAKIVALSDDDLNKVAGGDEDEDEDVDSKCGQAHKCGLSFIYCLEIYAG